MLKDPFHATKTNYSVEDILEDLIEGRISRGISDAVIVDAYEDMPDSESDIIIEL